MFSRFRATAPPCACRPNPAAGTTPQRTRPDRACVTGAGTIDFQEMGQGKEPVRRRPARPRWNATATPTKSVATVICQCAPRGRAGPAEASDGLSDGCDSLRRGTGLIEWRGGADRRRPGRASPARHVRRMPFAPAKPTKPKEKKKIKGNVDSRVRTCAGEAQQISSLSP